MPPLNPATATRAEFNNNYINELPTIIPSDANPLWKRLFDTTIALFKALAEDDAMAVNNTQTFNTPAANKNSQYFAWDFVMRTAVSFLYPIKSVMDFAPTLTLTERDLSSVFNIQSAPLIPSFFPNKKSYIVRSDSSLSSFDEDYFDACTRSMLITSLLLDERPGALAQMVERTYPGHNPGGQPPISAAVFDAAEEVKRALRENSAAISWVPKLD
jgi:hypothetical protein